MTFGVLAMPYLLCLAAVLGLIMGSFLNCLAWRMTHGESVLEGRSHCTSCGHVLGPADLVPVLSWVLMRGRCRYCGERVSWRYPVCEIVCCLMYVSIVWVWGLSLECVEYLLFGSILFVLSLTDLDSYIIPNQTIVCAVVVRLAYLVASWALLGRDLVPALLQSLVGFFSVGIAMILITLLMDFVLGKESFGGGDIKLLAVAGLYFGWQQSLFLIVVACVIGLVLGALTQRLGDAHAEDEAEGDGDDVTMKSGHPIPFGPAISIACWITMLWGQQAVAWYLGLFNL